MIQMTKPQPTPAIQSKPTPAKSEKKELEEGNDEGGADTNSPPDSDIES